MTSELVVALVVAALGGGGVVKLFEMFFQRKDTGLAAEERIVKLVIDEVTKQRDNYREQVEQLARQVETMELEIQGLRLVSGRDPFPRWLVDTQAHYMYLNHCFEERFLKPAGLLASDIIGKSHEEAGLWPPAFCAQLRTLDELAKQRPDGRAKATVGVNGQQLTVYKLPVRHVPSGTIIAYEGWITDIQAEEKLA